jgi:hypothetical protein
MGIKVFDVKIIKPNKKMHVTCPRSAIFGVIARF